MGWLELGGLKSLGGGGGGGLFGGSKRSYRRYRAQSFAELGKYQTALAQEQGQQIDAIEKGYGAAQGYAQKSAEGARQSVFDTQQRGEADIVQGLQRRGMSNLTTGGNIRRGLMSDTNRRLMEISDLLSRTQAGLAERKGQSLASVYSNGPQSQTSAARLALFQSLMGGGPPSAGQEFLQFGLDLAGVVASGVGASK